LKITATTTNGGFSIKLPKAVGAEGFTIRFMIEQMSATTSIFQIVKPYTHNGQIWEIYDSGATQNLAAKLGKWITVYVPAYSASSYDDVNCYVDFRTYTNVSSTKVIYIDEILVGNQVAALESRNSAN
jgi:hypothetical protein